MLDLRFDGSRERAVAADVSARVQEGGHPGRAVSSITSHRWQTLAGDFHQCAALVRRLDEDRWCVARAVSERHPDELRYRQCAKRRIGPCTVRVDARAALQRTGRA